MRRFLIVVSCLSCVSSTPAIEPPKILSTSPNFWEVGVSTSKQKVVTVFFDQVMRSGFWDFLGNNVLAPPTSYETTMGTDLKSFALKVNLEPGKVYILGLNERGIPGVGFQTVKGISMKPTYLVFQTAGNVSKEDAPPRAVSTAPANGVQDVNPATVLGIAVTFDREMDTKMHGLHLFEDKKPVDLKEVPFAYSIDGKSFTLKYVFKPSTHYEVQMNSTEDIGFAATNRVPLWPVHFSFTTGQPR